MLTLHLLGLPKREWETFKEEKQNLFLLSVLCTSLLDVFVVLSWLSLAGYYVLKFIVEPPEGTLLATSVMGAVFYA